jgi:hypothetical protein
MEWRVPSGARMSISSLIRRMTDAGAPPEAIAIAVEEIEAIQAALDARRSADRDRKREQRRRLKSADVTGQSDDSHGTVTGQSGPPFLDKKVSQTLQKTKPIQNPPISPQKFQISWNAMAASHKLPQIEGITGKRLRALMARIDEHGEDAVMRAISSVPSSPHWLGANGWLGNFDSLLRPENFQRMIEGAYVAVETRAQQKPGEPIPLWKHLRDQRQAAEATR